MSEIINILRKIRYQRLKPEEQYLIDIITNTTPHCVGYVNGKDGSYFSGVRTYYKYNDEIIFDVMVSEKTLTWQRMLIKGMDRNLKVKSLGWCKFDGFWSIFSTKFELDYVYVQDLFNRVIGEYYNLELPIFEMESSDTAYNIGVKEYEEKKYIHD